MYFWDGYSFLQHKQGHNLHFQVIALYAFFTSSDRYIRNLAFSRLCLMLEPGARPRKLCRTCRRTTPSRTRRSPRLFATSFMSRSILFKKGNCFDLPEEMCNLLRHASRHSIVLIPRIFSDL